jgi:hypothetical protein
MSQNPKRSVIMHDRRLIDFKTQEELSCFIDEFNQRLLNQGITLDKETEDWLDSEFHRIFVTYVYADVTSVN